MHGGVQARESEVQRSPTTNLRCHWYLAERRHRVPLRLRQHDRQLHRHVHAERENLQRAAAADLRYHGHLPKHWRRMHIRLQRRKWAVLGYLRPWIENLQRRSAAAVRRQRRAAELGSRVHHLLAVLDGDGCLRGRDERNHLLGQQRLHGGDSCQAGVCAPGPATGCTPMLTIVASTTAVFQSTTVSGSSAPLTFTVSNAGNATAGTTTGLSVTTTGANASDFSIASSNCPPTLAAGASCMVTVIFGPSAAGARSANLVASGSPGGSPS